MYVHWTEHTLCGVRLRNNNANVTVIARTLFFFECTEMPHPPISPIIWKDQGRFCCCVMRDGYISIWQFSVLELWTLPSERSPFKTLLSNRLPPRWSPRVDHLFLKRFPISFFQLLADSTRVDYRVYELSRRLRRLVQIVGSKRSEQVNTGGHAMSKVDTYQLESPLARSWWNLPKILKLARPFLRYTYSSNKLTRKQVYFATTGQLLDFVDPCEYLRLFALNLVKFDQVRATLAKTRSMFLFLIYISSNLRIYALSNTAQVGFW